MTESVEHFAHTQGLLDFLEGEAALPEPEAPFWNDMEQRYGAMVYSDILYHLTHMHMDADQAREHWHSILRHREMLRRTNQRDLGLRVALADYFINVTATVKNVMILEINLFQKKEELALKDELTGLYNRRFFNRMLQQELDRGRRFGQPVSLLMMDIDHFKEFNDSHGHPAGDQALVEIARIMRETCRSIDHLVRYGGEEFTLILPRSDQTKAFRAGQRLRAAVEEHSFLGNPDYRLTVSIGAATYPNDAGQGLELLEAADQSLYAAKREGRNRVASAVPRDKRRHPRFPIELRLVLSHQDQRFSIHGSTLDLSLGGLLGKTREAVDQGREMTCRLSLGEGRPEIMVRGRCVRIQPAHDEPDVYHLGFEFLPPSDEDRECLRLFIEDQGGAVN